MVNWNPEKYRAAWHFASLAHKGQTYGGPEKDIYIDYINHLASVAMEVTWALSHTPDYNGNLAIQCALLHDVIEDTKVNYTEVKQIFGLEVAEGVMALTKNTALPTKDAQMQDSLERIKQQPKEVWMVKLADRITNLYHPPFYWKDEKKLAYQQEARIIYQALAQANNILATRLADKIEAYSQFIQENS